MQLMQEQLFALTLRITYIPVSKKPAEIQQARILYRLRWVTLR